MSCTRNSYPLTKVCVVCRSDFVVNNGAEFRNISCSKACGNKHAAATRSGEGHWNWQSGRGVRRTFLGKHHSDRTRSKISAAKLGTPSWNKGRRGISDETRQKMHARKAGMHLSRATEFKQGQIPWNKGLRLPQFSGPNNPSWKGGVTPLMNKLRASVRYKGWERAVFARDGSCLRCGESRKRYLVAHHILNFAQHPRYRFRTQNGALLCKTCHAGFHKTYGKRNNSREQLREFLKTKRTDILVGYPIPQPRPRGLVRADRGKIAFSFLNEKFGTDFVKEFTEPVA